MLLLLALLRAATLNSHLRLCLLLLLLLLLLFLTPLLPARFLLLALLGLPLLAQGFPLLALLLLLCLSLLALLRAATFDAHLRLGLRLRLGLLLLLRLRLPTRGTLGLSLFPPLLALLLSLLALPLRVCGHDARPGERSRADDGREGYTLIKTCSHRPLLNRDRDRQ